MSLVLVSKVMARRGNGGFDKPMAFIEGEVKNTGDKSLDEVQLTVYLLDADKKPIHEHRCYAALATTISGERTPLKANYARTWTCGSENIPAEWNGSAVATKVTDVTFSSGPN